MGQFGLAKWASLVYQNHHCPPPVRYSFIQEQQEFFSLAEMQDYYEDRSESWQESERGEEHQEKSAATEAVVDALSDLLA